MQISKIELREYLAFKKSVYDDKNFKDNKTGVIKIVCTRTEHFSGFIAEMVAVKEKVRSLCLCTDY